ncbi:MAG: hypothetical protein M0D53_07695 [Flavobacterium sp. JAD_PAG50586_2]|nr:MAG: hypothetical protein M0D53_07695 [Flavobacterium sp. JAD_PAG50586_2]
MFLCLAVFMVTASSFAAFDGVVKTSCGKIVRFHTAASGDHLIEQIKIVNAVVCPGAGPVTVTIDFN